MLTPGLVSVTFRKLSRENIAEAMVNAGISAIEWGSDVHIPPNDENAVENALAVSRNFGIRTVSYGSYYRCTANKEEISATVSTAVKLGAKNIRVWAGTRESADADKDYRSEVVKNLAEMCREAAKFDLTVSPEFHGGTLTDHYESAVRLVDEVCAENLQLYWQPNQHRDLDYNRKALKAVLPYLSNVHVFSWSGDKHFPLVQGEREWREYIDIIRTSGRDHNMLLEFVCDDTAAQFYRDAETLLGWIEK